MQVIAQPDERYESYCRSSDFIREHIFPGGHLPSMGAMVEAARGTDLAVTAVRDIGPDYAITLRAWRKAWIEKKADVLALGYSEKFWLKYDFYFAYCEAAFDAKYIHDFHVTWEKRDGDSGSSARAPEGVAGVTGAVLGDAGGLQSWVKQELPSDSVTQVRKDPHRGLPAAAACCAQGSSGAQLWPSTVSLCRWNLNLRQVHKNVAGSVVDFTAVT